jgi:hypothetical protein
MSTTLTDPRNRIADYVKTLTTASPDAAVQIALAEAQRERALAEQAQAEYRAMAEVEFDAKGRITKANLAGLYRLSQAYSGSQIVPQHYQGKPSDCFIACQMAFRLGVDPLAYMQASYIVHGKPGIEAKLAVAMLNTSGKIKGRVSYKLTGRIEDKSRACTATAIDAETGEAVEATIDWRMVEAEGWLSKSGSKWKTMPDVMFHYRAAVFLIRMFYPEVMMGMQTRDELEDVEPEVAPAKSLDELTARIEGPQANGHAEPDEPATVTDAGERPQTAEEPDAALLDDLQAALAGAYEQLSVSLVSKAEEEFRTKAANEATRAAVSGLCSEIKAKIKASTSVKAQK